MKIPSENRGFTLVELLVVISIMSLLTSVVLASLTTARRKANDAARLQTVHQIDNAIQLYVTETGKAPTLGGTCPSSTLLSGASVFGCVAKSNPSYGDAASDAASAAAWSKLKLDLKKYIPTIKEESCGTNCANGLGYVYVSPAAVYFRCNTTGGCDPEAVTDSSYQVFTTLEQRASRPQSGFSTFSQLGTFYTPTYTAPPPPPPSGGGGGY
ncbi:MAG: hypothetical protein JWO73_814 [Candidatus Taylorbacteria bacterium]|nr:hypothetical protein [Candidatus Taylorbacteria bacterium]